MKEELTQAEVIQQLISDMGNSFQSPSGLRTLKHLSLFCLEKQSTFDEDSNLKTAFNEGARSVILEIRRLLEFDLSKLERKDDYEQNRIS